jgi:hypothetical protein
MQVMRQTLSWLIGAPLALVGSQLAHAEAYRLVYRNPHERAHELQASGHGYLEHAPLALALLLALVACGLTLRLLGARAGRGRELALWPFAVLPVLTFVLQEHLERGTLGGVLAEPTTVVGLLLQLPFALLAYVVARLLLRAADALAGTVAPPRLRRTATHLLAPSSAVLPRTPRLAFGTAQRGPPRVG